MKRILTLTAASLAALSFVNAAAVSVTTHDFSTGFSSGVLDGQQGWSAQSSWVVDITGGGDVATGTNYNRMRHSQSTGALSAGDTVTIMTAFTTPSAYVDTNANMLLFGFSDTNNASNNPASSNQIAATFGSRGTGDGQFSLRDEVFGAIAGASTAFEMNATTVGADWLLTYVYTHGADAASSTFGLTLANTTDGGTQTASIAGVTANTYTAAGLTGLYPFLNTSDIVKAGQSELSILSTQVVMVPEVGTYALLVGLCALSSVMVRRRR